MKLLVLTAADLGACLPMADAVDAMKDAFAAVSTGRVHAPLRQAIDAGDGAQTLLMGASIRGTGLAAKIVSVFPNNRATDKPVVTGTVLVLDPATGEPAALLDGTWLTAWRTGAASGAATDLLARPNAKVGAVLGCGAQARTQVIAIDTVRALDVIRVAARDRARIEHFIATAQADVGAHLEPAPSIAAAIDGADVICAATTSTTPLFDGSLLAPGTHLNAVGSFTPAMRELDETTIARSRVFVDAVGSAREEAGELIAALAAGATRETDWTELGRVAAGAAPGRTGRDDITVFKSVGHPAQDVAAASRALAFARAHGLGSEVLL